MVAADDRRDGTGTQEGLTPRETSRRPVLGKTRPPRATPHPSPARGEAAALNHHPMPPPGGDVPAMTSVFITFDRMADRVLSDALRSRGITLIFHAFAEMFHGDTDLTADAVDAWFSDLPWAGEDTATLTVYGGDVTITTVVIDGELASTTRADSDGVLVDDYLEDAA